MMNKKKVYQNCKFYDPWVWVFMLGHDHKAIRENMRYLLLCQYTASWLLLYNGVIMLLKMSLLSFIYSTIGPLIANMSPSD